MNCNSFCNGPFNYFMSTSIRYRLLLLYHFLIFNIFEHRRFEMMFSYSIYSEHGQNLKIISEFLFKLGTYILYLKIKSKQQNTK